MTNKANPFVGLPPESPATDTLHREADLGSLLAASSFGSEQARAIRAQTPQAARDHGCRILEEVSPPSLQRDGEDAISRVVLIDGCSGVQYGRGNEQYSAYLVKLPSVALESGEALARHLLSNDGQWSHAVFDNSGRASFAGLAGTGSGFSGTDETLAGDTLVIVRNSRGVQVGDGNTQHNQFQVQVTNVTIRAVRVSSAVVSRAAVDHLRQHPTQAAARAVAAQIAAAARDYLIVDMTAQVSRKIGSPVITGQPAVISGRTGVQAGGSARAHVRVEVEAADVKVDHLAAELLRQARREDRARRVAAAEQAVTVSTPGGDADLEREEPAALLAAELDRIARARQAPRGHIGPARPGISPLGF